MGIYSWKVLPIPVAAIALALGFVMKKTAYREAKVVKAKKVDLKIPEDRVKKVVLDNGMIILLLKDTATPTVLVQIAYDV
ncbi:hypothetical protein ACFLY6_03265, partial [Candidatus Dependentiae bacterium]